MLFLCKLRALVWNHSIMYSSCFSKELIISWCKLLVNILHNFFSHYHFQWISRSSNSWIIRNNLFSRSVLVWFNFNYQFFRSTLIYIYIYMRPIFSKPVGYRGLWKASNRRLKWENPFLVTFDIFALTVRKTISKFIVSVTFPIKWF